MKRLWIALLLASCTSRRPEVPILNYHSVAAGEPDYAVEPRAFDEQLDWLARRGFHTISLRELAEARAKKAAPDQRSIVLTFDDGKEDALTVVAPALRRRGMRGTFFVITALVGRPGYLTWEGVRTLAGQGMEIGSHTATHARLPDLPDERVRQELAGSKARLESELKQPVEVLAYPYNAVRSRIVDAAAQAGFRVAVSGVAHGGANLLNLRRIPVNGATTMEQFERALAGR